MKIKALLIALIFLPLIGCDRITKIQAVSHLKGQEPISFLSGLFSLTYHENTGAMLSFGANFPEELRFFIFTVLAGIALAAGFIYIIVKPMRRIEFCLALLIIAGGIGNLYDRAFNSGKVVDFMLIDLGPVRTGVFNVADMAIMAGIFGFIIFSGKRDRQKSTPSPHIAPVHSKMII